MPAQPTEWTAEMARALPDDGKRNEVLDGELFVTPAPSWNHQRAVRDLLLALHPYVSDHALGEVVLSPADIEFSPRRLLQPDVFVVPPGESRRSWSDITRLELVCEVLSPTTARADRHQKRVIYQDERVPEYWIVDLDARLVELWRPDDTRPEIVTDVLRWQPRAAFPPLEIELAIFFRSILG